jgi:hypothetical protein
MNGSNVIEADLTGAPAESSLDPISRALRERGFRSISIGLRTAQVDGALYDLCSLGQAVVTDWLQGNRSRPQGTLRLVRHTITA